MLKDLIIVEGDRVLLKRPGTKGFRKEVPLEDVLAALEGYTIKSHQTPGEALPVPPYGAKAMWVHGNKSVIHVEVPPRLRVVHWILDTSHAAYGGGVEDAPVSLAFPWINIFIKCEGDCFQGHQCLTYRTAPSESMDDKLYQSNLLNVSDVPGTNYMAWFCTQYLKIPKKANTWDAKIRLMIDHLWAYTFTKSSEHHEGNSYWKYNHDLDKRIKTLSAWKNASVNPDFMLGVKWPQMKHRDGKLMTIRSLVHEMLDLGHTKTVKTVTNNKQLLNVIRSLPKKVK